MSEKDLKREICCVMANIVSARLTTAYGGNVSSRLPDEKWIWITPSGLFKGSLDPGSLAKLDLKGGVIEGEMKPSREAGMHLLIYEARRDVNAVIHCHPRFATALGIAGRTISPVSVEGAMLGRVPLVPYSMPGSRRLAREASRSVSAGVNVAILQNHGVLAVGGSLESAFRRVQTLETAAEMMFIAEGLGSPTTIRAGEVRKLLEIGSV